MKRITTEQLIKRKPRPQQPTAAECWAWCQKRGEFPKIQLVITGGSSREEWTIIGHYAPAALAAVRKAIKAERAK